jgi:hypothetical protein
MCVNHKIVLDNDIETQYNVIRTQERRKQPMAENKKYTHLTEEEISEGEEIHELMKNLDEFAQQLLLERARGMRQMQEIMNKKSA